MHFGAEFSVHFSKVGTFFQTKMSVHMVTNLFPSLAKRRTFTETPPPPPPRGGNNVHHLRVKIAAFHFLDNLHHTKYILLTIVFNGILSPCKTLHLKDHDSIEVNYLTVNGDCSCLVLYLIFHVSQLVRTICYVGGIWLFKEKDGD